MSPKVRTGAVVHIAKLLHDLDKGLRDAESFTPLGIVDFEDRLGFLFGAFVRSVANGAKGHFFARMTDVLLAFSGGVKCVFESRLVIGGTAVTIAHVGIGVPVAAMQTRSWSSGFHTLAILAFPICVSEA